MSLFRASEPTGVRVNTRTGPRESPVTGPAWWVAALLLAGALLVQIEFAHLLAWRNAQPSFVLVLVAWYAMHTDWRSAAFFGLAAGACEDAFATGTGASWTFATLGEAIFANVLARWFFANSIPVAAIVAFACTLLRQLVFWIFMGLTMSYPPGYARMHAHQALWSALMNAVLIVICMAAARRFEERRT